MAKGIAPAPAGFPPTVVDALRQIEVDLGGRAHIVGLLTLAPLNSDLRYILGLLGDPKNQTKSLAAICALGSILPGELIKHLSAAALLRGKVLASQAIGDGIQAVAQDVMRRAAPFEETCYACRGTGSVVPEPTKEVPNPEAGPCEACGGGGVLRYQPELERQKLAIEMAQLLPKGGGLHILNANVQGASGGAGGSGTPLERLQQLTDQILYGKPGMPGGLEEDPPVEGTVVADPPPPADAG